jgi:hypothetical protein
VGSVLTRILQTQKHQLWFVSDFTSPRRLRDHFRQQFRRLYSHGFLRCGFYWRCNVDYMPKQLPIQFSMEDFFLALNCGSVAMPVFLPCLNDACGNCLKAGYTGPTCTDCEPVDVDES